MAGQTTSSGIQVHRVPASHGWYWLKRGFGLLGRAPLPLLLLMLMLITASNLFGILGIVGLVLAKLVVPVLLVGYLAILRQLAPPGSGTPVAAQSTATPQDTPAPGTRAFTQIFNAGVFFGWAQGKRRALLAVAQLGLLSLAIDTGAAWLSGYQDAVAAMLDMLSQMPANKVPDAETMNNLVMPVFQSMMTMAVITVPYYLLLWYAPIFAGLHGLPLLKSVVFSAVAVGRNALAFVCHALCLLVFLISVALVTQVLSGTPALPFASPIFLLVLPVVFAVIACALWACYLDTVEVAGQDSFPPRLQNDTDRG